MLLVLFLHVVYILPSRQLFLLHNLAASVEVIEKGTFCFLGGGDCSSSFAIRCLCFVIRNVWFVICDFYYGIAVEILLDHFLGEYCSQRRDSRERWSWNFLCH